MKFENFTDRDKFKVLTQAAPNPLDPRGAAVLGHSLIQPESAPSQGSARSVSYTLCIPPKLWKKYVAWLRSVVLTTVAVDNTSAQPKYPVNVTLFFAAPDNDQAIDTLGFRFFLKDVDDTIFVVIPNFETHGATRKEPKNAGITTKMIEALLTAIGAQVGIPVRFDFKVTCATAYSAGYGGLAQSINNELFDLQHLKKIVYYDCLYRADHPPLPAGQALPRLERGEDNTGPDEIDSQHRASAFNTRRAIIKARSKSANVQVVAYCATLGGSPKYLEGNKGYTVAVDKLIDLRAGNLPNYLFALSLARVLVMARDEGIITPSEIPPPILALYNSVLPARGLIASATSQLTTSKTGFIPTTTLKNWGDIHSALINDAKSIFDEAAALVGNKRLFYVGYPSRGNPGGMLHIAQIFEFGWEEFL